MTDGPSNGDIMRALGRIEADQKNATTSRRVIHEKMETVIKEIQDLKFDVKVAADIAVQARDQTISITREIDEEIKPALADASNFKATAEPIISNMKMVRNSVLALVAALGLMGVGVGTVMAFANDMARVAVIGWLYPNEKGPDQSGP